MRPTVRAFSLESLRVEPPQGVEAEVIFVHDSADAAFDRARASLGKARLGPMPRHITLNCAEGMWDGIVNLGALFGSKGVGYLDRVYKALSAFMTQHPGESLCVWIDEAHALSAYDREGLFRLLKHCAEMLNLDARICLILRQKEIKVHDGKQWRKVWRFPTEGRRLPQIARCWNANSKGLMETDWNAAAESDDDETTARHIATA